VAQGSIIWRCNVCGNHSKGPCKHPRAGYSIVYRAGDRQRWEAVGRSKKNAERRLAEVMSELHKGAYFAPKPIKFSEFSRKWLSEYAECTLKPLTVRSYRGLIDKHLKPTFGARALTKITPNDIQAFLSKQRRETNLSARTINMSLIILKGLFNYACKWGHLHGNPAEGIKQLRQEHHEMDYLKPDEVRLLLNHSGEPYKTLFMTAILTGMRMGELFGLQWGDIDWRNNIIRVHRGIYWRLSSETMQNEKDQNTKWAFSHPKSKRSVRAIVMSPKLHEALQAHKARAQLNPHQLIFCTQNGGPLHPSNVVRRHYHPALARAGLRRIRFHDLRHTYTALLIAQGANIKLIQAQLGHASIQTTLDRYGHLLPDAHHRVGERLDAQVFPKVA